MKNFLKIFKFFYFFTIGVYAKFPSLFLSEFYGRMNTAMAHRNLYLHIVKVSGLSFKSQIPRPLKGKYAKIAFFKKNELVPRHLQLHAVAALYLEGHVIGMRVMVMSVCMVVMVCYSSFCHDPCFYGQPWRIVVIDPFTDVFDENEDEQSKK